MAIPENQHCANCIGTLSFPMGSAARYMQSIPKTVCHGGCYAKQNCPRRVFHTTAEHKNAIGHCDGAASQKATIHTLPADPSLQSCESQLHASVIATRYRRPGHRDVAAVQVEELFQTDPRFPLPPVYLIASIVDDCACFSVHR